MKKKELQSILNFSIGALFKEQASMMPERARRLLEYKEKRVQKQERRDQTAGKKSLKDETIAVSSSNKKGTDLGEKCAHSAYLLD